MVGAFSVAECEGVTLMADESGVKLGSVAVAAM